MIFANKFSPPLLCGCRRLLFVIAVLTAGCLSLSQAQTQAFVVRTSAPKILHAATLIIPAGNNAIPQLLQRAAPSIQAWTFQHDALRELQDAQVLEVSGFALPNGSIVDLTLQRFSIFTSDAVILTVAEDGEHRRPLPDIAMFKGKVKGDLQSWVYLAVEETGISGSIITGGDTYSLTTEQSVTVLGTSVPVLCVYLSSPETKAYTCSVSEDDIFETFSQKKFDGTRPFAANDTLEARIAIEADFAAFQHYGSVQATENYIMARMGESSAIYERDVAITLTVPFLRVWQTEDPFPGNSDRELLNVFTKYWSENMDTVSRALALLISRKPISANGVSQGLAWVDVLCKTNRGYNIVKFSSNNGFTDGHTGVLAHEIGHNFGSPHTHSCLWKPPIDSCYTAEGGCFSSADQHLILGGGEMMSYCHLPYGNKNHYNIFRDRTGGLIRTRADAASCMNVISTVRTLDLLTPAGGEAICAGTMIQITWDASGNNSLTIRLSSDGGTSWPTLLAQNIERSQRSWFWVVPGNSTPGTQYKIRIEDEKNGTLVDEMSTPFEIKEGVYIIGQNTWRNVCVGQGARFDIKATGPGTLTYEWKKNGVVLPNAVTDTIWYQNCQPVDDKSRFTCTITSDCGSVVSDTILLRVFSNPVITMQPKNDTVCIGGTATFRIEAEGPDLTYKWLTVGKVFNVNSPEFTINNVTDADRNGYYCEVSSPCGKMNSYTGLLVIPTPSALFQGMKPYQELPAGGQYDINWKHYCLTNVKLDYTLDDGANWNPLGTFPANNLKFTWPVPNTETNTGAFRISDPANPSGAVRSPTFIIKRRPTATLSTTELNFGLIPVRSPTVKTLSISNSGVVALNVSQTKIVGNNDVTVMNGAPFTVPPAGTYDLDVQAIPSFSGPIVGKLILDHDALQQHDTLNLVGDAFVVLTRSSLPHPGELFLSQSFPNPVSLSQTGLAQISFDLPKAGFVKLALYSTLGNEMRTLVQDSRIAGRFSLTFNVSDLPAGTYLYRLTADGKSITRAMHILR